jgi:Tfp pilus assembly protein PilV
MGKTLNTETGASLVEILIAVIIISITAMLIMSFSRSTFNMTKDSRSSEAAYISAEEKLAELTTKAFHEAPWSDKDTIDNIIMNRSWVVNDTNTIKRAIVTVTYPSIKGTSRSITLSGAIN